MTKTTKTDNNGKNTYSYNNKNVDIELSKDGTLRVSHKEFINRPRWGGPNGPMTVWESKTIKNIVDFKLRDNYMPQNIKDTDIEDNSTSGANSKNKRPNALMKMILLF